MHRRLVAGRRLVFATLAALTGALGASACAEPLEFADWTVPVPEGTEVIGYAPVDAADREGRRVELIEDLTIGARGDDERYLFYRPGDIDVAPDGSIYVLDRGNFDVKVFDAEGEHVRTFANQGEGPGELAQPRAAAIVGDRYVAGDGGAHISMWWLDGEYLDSLPRRGTTGLLGTRQVMTASADGDLYLTNGDEYQAMSWDRSGAPRWALRVAQPRQPYSEAQIENVLAQQRERYSDIQRSELEMADQAPTLSSLLVDGHGHLYALLYTWVAPFSESHDYPIDVYSPAGVRRFAGSITLALPGGFWEAAPETTSTSSSWTRPATGRSFATGWRSPSNDAAASKRGR